MYSINIKVHKNNVVVISRREYGIHDGTRGHTAYLLREAVDEIVKRIQGMKGEQK